MDSCLKLPNSTNFGELSFMNYKLSDVNIVLRTARNQCKFYAHKIVLSCASPYFRAILQDEDIEEITLDNLTQSETYMLLRYMYCGDLQAGSWLEMNNLMYAAFEYKMDNLIKTCANVLKNIITIQNVCLIYEKATVCSSLDLQNKCLMFILDTGFVILRSYAFQQLNQYCVMNIISNFNLNIDREYIVFEALFRWALSECTRQNLKISEDSINILLQPFLKYLCVNDMSDTEKSRLPPSILETVKSNNNHSRVVYHIPQSLHTHMHSLELETNYNILEFLGNSLECIRFSVNRHIYLLGMQFKCVAKPAQVLYLKVLKENCPITKLAESTVTIEKTCTKTLNQNVWLDSEIMLSHPVYLTTSTVYMISMADEEMMTQVPQTKLSHSDLHTPTGYLNLSLISNEIWGITKFLFL